MCFVFIDQSYRTQSLAENLQKHWPKDSTATHKLHIWPDVPPNTTPHYAIIWRPPENSLQAYPHLKAIFCLGAGVDGLTMQPHLLPANVPLVRYVDKHLAQGMAEYALYHVLHYHRHFGIYAHQQQFNHWQQLPQIPSNKLRVGVMGLGEMGMAVIKALQPLGYQLLGFSRTPKDVAGVKTFTDLPTFLQQTDILINVLPLTPHTTGILNKQNLSQLPQGAKMINMGRGNHHVLPDIIELLDTGHLGGATLDVFDTEPLPRNHAAWLHPKINVTPHIASISNIKNIVAYIFEQVAKLENGQSLNNVVDLEKQY